jgi:hypothetical protein
MALLHEGRAMASNLLRPRWKGLDSDELRTLLEARVGGPGQIDPKVGGENRFYLPLARGKCRLVLVYRGRQITRVERGQAFDQAEWDRIAEEIETSVITGPTKFGRDYSFCSYRVKGSWRGAKSRVQILPPHPEAPLVPAEMGEHPFILEFPLRNTNYWPVTNLRRQVLHFRLTLLLNTLLAGRMNVQPRRAAHFWGVTHEGGGFKTTWVQNTYFGELGNVVLDEASAPTEERLPEIDAGRYFEEVRGIDGQGLRLPSDLDESICRYLALPPNQRADYDRAAYWLDLASRQWNISLSASFAALVSVIEALINKRGRGSTERFCQFLEQYAPGKTLEARRNEMYEVRSGILHGSSLMSLDEEFAFGWTPWWLKEKDLHDELWTVTRIAVRNWLRNPPPV